MVKVGQNLLQTLPLLYLLLLQLMTSALAFQQMKLAAQYSKKNSILMRDGSTASVFFAIGDKVRIIKDVWHHPKSLPSFTSIKMIGTVCDIWEKCEVDPHCCCAELAFDAPVQVRFAGSQYDADTDNWTAHFALDEILLIDKWSCVLNDFRWIELIDCLWMTSLDKHQHMNNTGHPTILIARMTFICVMWRFEKFSPLLLRLYGNRHEMIKWATWAIHTYFICWSAESFYIAAQYPITVWATLCCLH